MPLVSLQNVDYGVGGPLLLDGVDLAIEAGERIALAVVSLMVGIVVFRARENDIIYRL